MDFFEMVSVDYQFSFDAGTEGVFGPSTKHQTSCY
jgi:hypothetical protein